jgi:hypothetical protein
MSCPGSSVLTLDFRLRVMRAHIECDHGRIPVSISAEYHPRDKRLELPFAPAYRTDFGPLEQLRAPAPHPLRRARDPPARDRQDRGRRRKGTEMDETTRPTSRTGEVQMSWDPYENLPPAASSHSPAVTCGRARSWRCRRSVASLPPRSSSKQITGTQIHAIATSPSPRFGNRSPKRGNRAAPTQGR